MPVCKTCGTDRDIEDFHKSPTCKGGRREVCKQCVAAKLKAYRDANRERILEQKRQERVRCKDAIKKRNAAYYAANKEKHAAGHKAWYERNKESVIARISEWQQANPERVKAAKRKNKLTRKDTVKAEYKRNKADYFSRAAARRATVKQVTPAWANKEEMAEMYIIASKLNGFFTKPFFHVDHIVPLVSPLVCGLHTPANLQLLSAQANLSKHNRHWPEMP